MITRCLPATSELLDEAATLIRRGELVAFPTETVYGLGADATNPAAVAKIYQVKGRPSSNPLIVHIHDISQLSTVADLSRTQLGPMLNQLTPLWPGPLSLVLPRAQTITPLVSAGGDTVAVRIPDHDIARNLIARAGVPIAAPSANRSGYVSPTTAAHVEAGLSGLIPLIIDGGPCPIGIESTVVSLVGAVPRLLRPGGVSFEQLRELLPTIVLNQPSAQTTGPVSSEPLSPGLLTEHYAPTTPLVLRTDFARWCTVHARPARLVSICFHESSPPLPGATRREVVSTTGDRSEIARNLFAAIRRFDDGSTDLIVVDSCDELGLGRAIMDRLIRARARSLAQLPPT